jgi:hypothetical protein
MERKDKREKNVYTWLLKLNTLFNQLISIYSSNLVLRGGGGNVI